MGKIISWVVVAFIYLWAISFAIVFVISIIRIPFLIRDKNWRELFYVGSSKFDANIQGFVTITVFMAIIFYIANLVIFWGS